MVHHRQQLDVREAHVVHVCGELVGELDIGQRRLPSSVFSRHEPRWTS